MADLFPFIYIRFGGNYRCLEEALPYLPEKPCQSSPYRYFAFAKMLPYNDLSASAAGERLNKFKE